MGDLTALYAAIGAALASPVLLKVIDVYRLRHAGDSGEVAKLRAELKDEWLKSREQLRAELRLMQSRLDECAATCERIRIENVDLRVQMREMNVRLRQDGYQG